MVSIMEFVVLLYDWRDFGKNSKRCDEHIRRMVRPLRTESYLYGTPHKPSARALEVLLSCAASEYDVEGYH